MFFIKYILVFSKELTWLIIILCEAYYFYTAIMTINVFWQLHVLAHSTRYKIFSRWHFEVYIISWKQILAFHTNCLQMIWQYQNALTKKIFIYFIYLIFIFYFIFIYLFFILFLFYFYFIFIYNYYYYYYYYYCIILDVCKWLRFVI